MQKFGLESMLFIHKSQKSVQCFSPDKQIESMVLSGLKNVKRERSLLPPFFYLNLTGIFSSEYFFADLKISTSIRIRIQIE